MRASMGPPAVANTSRASTTFRRAPEAMRPTATATASAHSGAVRRPSRHAQPVRRPSGSGRALRAQAETCRGAEAAG